MRFPIRRASPQTATMPATHDKGEAGIGNLWRTACSRNRLPLRRSEAAASVSRRHSAGSRCRPPSARRSQRRRSGCSDRRFPVGGLIGSGRLPHRHVRGCLTWHGRKPCLWRWHVPQRSWLAGGARRHAAYQAGDDFLHCATLDGRGGLSGAGISRTPGSSSRHQQALS